MKLNAYDLLHMILIGWTVRGLDEKDIVEQF